MVQEVLYTQWALFKLMFLNEGCYPSGDIWQRLETLLTVTTWAVG